jgi:hypothetical protein
LLSFEVAIEPLPILTATCLTLELLEILFSSLSHSLSASNQIAMYFRTLVVFPCLYAGVFAISPDLTGSFSNFRAESMKTENYTVGSLYDSCKEFDRDGELVSVGRGCVATLLWNTYQVLIASTGLQPVQIIHNDTLIDQEPPIRRSSSIGTGTVPSQPTAVTTPSSHLSAVTIITSSLQSTITTLPDAYNIKLKRENDQANSMLLGNLNEKLSQQLGGKHGIRALDIGKSELHPEDGVAIRTNIRGDNAVLHVHTNGSHATAEFKKETVSQISRRYQDVPMAYNFRFSEAAFGIKMQVTKINRVDASLSDMHAYWNAFGYGNGEIDIAPAFNGSDSWKFVVCDKGWKQVIAGKVIALENPSDYGYESYDESIPCV